MLQVVSTGAYYPLVVTTWKIFTTGTSYLTTGTLCTVVKYEKYSSFFLVALKNKLFFIQLTCLGPE